MSRPRSGSVVELSLVAVSFSCNPGWPRSSSGTRVVVPSDPIFGRLLRGLSIGPKGNPATRNPIVASGPRGALDIRSERLMSAPASAMLGFAATRRRLRPRLCARRRRVPYARRKSNPEELRSRERLGILRSEWAEPPRFARRLAEGLARSAGGQGGCPSGFRVLFALLRSGTESP